MLSPIISIIIPCFNSGNHLLEALDSIKGYKGEIIYEVIIINDGSTDPQTLQTFDKLDKETYILIHQENKGPAAARNTGIGISKGKYLFFLDSDNKLRSSYLDKGVEILNALPHVGIVYGNPFFFGEFDKPRFVCSDFNLLKILGGNYIDMCTIIRKKVFEEVGGLDEERIIIGHEDWEFWIRVSATGWEFYYINELLFDYRISQDSLSRQASEPENYKKMLHYIYSKHHDILLRHYKFLYHQFLHYERDKKNPFRTFFKFLYLKYFPDRELTPHSLEK